MNAAKLEDIDYTSFSPADFDRELPTIKSQLQKNGIIFVKNIFSTEDATRIANLLGNIVENLDADNQGITEISNKRDGNNKKNSIAFTTRGLTLHTDRSPIINPPNLLMNWVCVKDCFNGESLLVDGYKIYDYIKSINESYIEILSQPNIACFTDGIDTFTGPIFNIDDNDNLEIRFRYDQCSFFKLEAKRAVNLFLKAAAQLSHLIDFEIGSGYIIKNNRWLHGRKPFIGYRMIRRIHIMEKL